MSTSPPTRMRDPGRTLPLKPRKMLTLDSLKGKQVLFVMMPFAEGFADVWQGAIERAATEAGYMPVRVDMLTSSSRITDDIVTMIRRSSAVLADVTGNNPNVMLELGYSLALRKVCVIITQSEDYLFFDIKDIRAVIYEPTWRGIESLHSELLVFLQGTTPDRRRKREGVIYPACVDTR